MRALRLGDTTFVDLKKIYDAINGLNHIHDLFVKESKGYVY